MSQIDSHVLPSDIYTDSVSFENSLGHSHSTEQTSSDCSDLCSYCHVGHCAFTLPKFSTLLPTQFITISYSIANRVHLSNFSNNLMRPPIS